MGLTSSSTGKNANHQDLLTTKSNSSDYIIGLAGNPNVGKSTVFNALTGLNQHTGNWPGKTVTQAQGTYTKDGINYILVDIPGAYSLLPHSAEEEVARNFICFHHPDVIIIVCDATCLERNLNLVLQILEVTHQVIICVNLLDEAYKKHIQLDLAKLSVKLGVPVVGTNARNRVGLDLLMNEVTALINSPPCTTPINILYPTPVEKAISYLEPALIKILPNTLCSRFIALQILEESPEFLQDLQNELAYDFTHDESFNLHLAEAKAYLNTCAISTLEFKDQVISHIIHTAEAICKDIVFEDDEAYTNRDLKIDKILTSKRSGIPTMIILLIFSLWLTIVGANYPSDLLFNLFIDLEEKLMSLLVYIGTPAVLCEMLIYGVYRVLTWVIAVMLPPMAIFFPLFTLLEDVGYLPRVAFNLDQPLKKCSACGKQSLTMCMGLGCNAAGVVGCRIIDSPRERLIAIITNSFIPCNGRFPTFISIINMFFLGMVISPLQSLFSTFLLTSVILLGIAMTFLFSTLLSKTILKGLPSSFTLELPPYRKPQILKVLVRSLLDRTLYVLKRAILVAAPAGFIIWLMANISINDISLLIHCARFLDPFAKLLGLDGIILIAFILGFPANEVVVPIMIMAYTSAGYLTQVNDLSKLRLLLLHNGWTPVTAICMMLFLLMHWPCSTTCLTIYKETQSFKWTLVSFLVPTVAGMLICFIVATLSRLFL